MTEYILTEEQKKGLTEWLGEKWHETIESKWTELYGTLDKCNCGMVECQEINRTFTTWQDLGDLFTKLNERGEWLDFCNFAWLIFVKDTTIDPERPHGTWERWLLHPQRFGWLVSQFIGREK